MKMTDKNRKCPLTDEELFNDIRMAEAKRVYSGKVDVEAQWKRFKESVMEPDCGNESPAIENGGRWSRTWLHLSGKKLFWYAVAACVAVVFVFVGQIETKLPQGVSLEKEANGEQILKVARGTVYTVTLPDGTTAELQPDTRLFYPKKFCGKTRTVRLEGEAYFEVKKDREKPFVVATEEAEVQVLGTHFNVKAYRGEPYRISLLEGSVKVRNLQCPDSVLMYPGDNVCLDIDSMLAFISGDSRFEMRRKGMFFYDNAPLREILNDICRHYDVKIVCESLSQCRGADTKTEQGLYGSDSVAEDSSVLSMRLHFSAPYSLGAEGVVERLNSFKSIKLRIENKINII